MVREQDNSTGLLKYNPQVVFYTNKKIHQVATLVRLHQEFCYTVKYHYYPTSLLPVAC